MSNDLHTHIEDSLKAFSSSPLRKASMELLGVLGYQSDKIMLWNSGHLPPELTPARLFRKHPSLPANPDVANAFFRAGMIEAWGDGYERIVDACHAAGNPKPKVRCEAQGIWLEFAFPKEYLARVQVAEPLEGGSPEGGVKTGVKTRVKTRVKILSLLRSNASMSREELAHQLGITVKGVDWQIAKLKQEGKLKRVGPDKGGHWEVLENNS